MTVDTALVVVTVFFLFVYAPAALAVHTTGGTAAQEFPPGNARTDGTFDAVIAGNPERVASGGAVTFTAKVTNIASAPVDASAGLYIYFARPGSTTYVSGLATAGHCSSMTGQTPGVSCPVGTLDPGRSVTVSLTVRARVGSGNVSSTMLGAAVFVAPEATPDEELVAWTCATVTGAPSGLNLNQGCAPAGNSGEGHSLATTSTTPSALSQSGGVSHTRTTGGKTADKSVAGKPCHATPVAVFSTSVAKDDPQRSVTFNATESQGCGPLRYIWRFGDTATTHSLTTTHRVIKHTFARAGRYGVVLRVQDVYGLRSAPTSHELAVSDTPKLYGLPCETPCALVETTLEEWKHGITFSFPSPSALPAAGTKVACSPRSGSRFPVGQTRVTCTATNTDGKAHAYFEVQVTGYSHCGDSCRASAADGGALLDLMQSVPKGVDPVPIFSSTWKGERAAREADRAQNSACTGGATRGMIGFGDMFGDTVPLISPGRAPVWLIAPYYYGLAFCVDAQREWHLLPLLNNALDSQAFMVSTVDGVDIEVVASLCPAPSDVSVQVGASTKGLLHVHITDGVELRAFAVLLPALMPADLDLCSGEEDPDGSKHLENRYLGSFVYDATIDPDDGVVAASNDSKFTFSDWKLPSKLFGKHVGIEPLGMVDVGVDPVVLDFS